MIVFCEDCGERNVVDLEEIKKGGGPIRCKACYDILKISLPQDEKTERIAPAEATEGILILEFGGQTVELSKTRPSVTMGRQEHNDLEVIDTRVSRSHARIEFRDGDFFLIDHSTNGTFLMQDDGKGVSLKRGEAALNGSGIITLGRKAPGDSPKAIHYRLK